MPKMQEEDGPTQSAAVELPPVAYEGHESIGFECLRCGVHLKPGARWRKLHTAWHKAVDSG